MRTESWMRRLVGDAICVPDGDAPPDSACFTAPFPCPAKLVSTSDVGFPGEACSVAPFVHNSSERKEATMAQVNLNSVVTFFDPHPGLLGCPVPIPDAVKQVADALNGQSLLLAEAVERIQRAAGGEVEVAFEHRHISFELPGILRGCPCTHSWRVIRFR